MTRRGGLNVSLNLAVAQNFDSSRNTRTDYNLQESVNSVGTRTTFYTGRIGLARQIRLI